MSSNFFIVRPNFFIFPAAAQCYIWSACTDRSFSSTLLLRDAEGHISPKKVIITTAGALIEIAPIVGLVVEAAKYIFSKPQTMSTPLLGGLIGKLHRGMRISFYFTLASTSWVATGAIFKYLKSNILQKLPEEWKNSMNVADLKTLALNPNTPANLKADIYLAALKKNSYFDGDSVPDDDDPTFNDNNLECSLEYLHQAYALKDQTTQENQETITRSLQKLQHLVTCLAFPIYSRHAMHSFEVILECAKLSPEAAEPAFRKLLQGLVSQQKENFYWNLRDEQYEKIKEILECFAPGPFSDMSARLQERNARTNPRKFEEVLNEMKNMTEYSKARRFP